MNQAQPRKHTIIFNERKIFNEREIFNEKKIFDE